MFTGIIQSCGKILEKTQDAEKIRFKISSTLSAKDLHIGNSIAVNGVCLTVESSEESTFEVCAIEETLNLTNLGSLETGDAVNLEAALRMETPIAGHLVLGHVDGMAEVLTSGERLKLRLPQKLVKYCPYKGSVCVNGVSLTIAEQSEDSITLALIPETLRQTTLGQLEAGSKVNIEIDSIARYLEHLIKHQ